MKFDKSLSGYSCKEAFEVILKQTSSDLGHVLMIRSDDPAQVVEMKRQVKEIKHAIYLQFGGVLRPEECYTEILRHLGSKTKNQRNIICTKSIIEHVKNRKGGPIELFVFDNCHYLQEKNMCLLLGLLYELAGFVQFIFIVPEYYVKPLKKKSESKRWGLFLNALEYKYDITS